MVQLLLPFLLSTKTDGRNEEDFVFLPENSAAVNFLKKFFSQKDFTRSQFPSLIIKGEEFCGKTHLLHIFAKKFEGEFLDSDKISDLNLINFFQPNHFYILEDTSKIKDEELLLRILNSASESKAFFILTTQNHSEFKLRDLVSRLNNIFSVEIKNPSLESIKLLLTSGFARRQIKLSRSIIDFIANKIERNYSAISAAVKKIEFYFQEGGKKLTVKNLKSIL